MPIWQKLSLDLHTVVLKSCAYLDVPTWQLSKAQGKVDHPMPRAEKGEGSGVVF